MPTYLDQYRNVHSIGSESSKELNCREVYEHIQGCPLCKTALGQTNSFTASPTIASDIPQSVLFLVIVLIIIMVMYIVKNLSNDKY
jgi:hypothetical protein